MASAPRSKWISLAYSLRGTYSRHIYARDLQKVGVPYKAYRALVSGRKRLTPELSARLSHALELSYYSRLRASGAGRSEAQKLSRGHNLEAIQTTISKMNAYAEEMTFKYKSYKDKKKYKSDLKKMKKKMGETGYTTKQWDRFEDWYSSHTKRKFPFGGVSPRARKHRKSRRPAQYEH